MTVVLASYHLPHLRDSKAKLVSAVYVNLEKAMENPSDEEAAWTRHRVEIDRLISVPRFAASEEAKKAAQRLGISIRKVIYHGIDLALFYPIRSGREDQSDVVISLYCDPHPQKGLDVGVEAFRGLKSADPSIRLCSIGRLKDGQKDLFDRNYGYLHGEDYARAIQESDILVYPSWYDGFPAPPLHAMACGVALVTTAVEGVSEYAVHEVNALLSEPGDVQGMQSNIVRLIQDRELRQRLQANGSKTALAFGLKESAVKLLEFLQEVYEEDNELLPVLQAWGRS